MFEKSYQLGENRPIIKNFGTKDEREPLVYDISRKIEQLRLEERAVVQLRVDRGEGYGVRLFVGKRHPAPFKRSNNAGQAKAAAKIENLQVSTFYVLIDVTRQRRRAGPQMRPIRRLLGLVPQKRLSINPTLQVLHTQERELARADSQFEGFAIISAGHIHDYGKKKA
jgi:hypothetical protein